MHPSFPIVALIYCAGILAGSLFLVLPLSAIVLGVLLLIAGTALVLAGRAAPRPALLTAVFFIAGTIAAVSTASLFPHNHYRNTLSFDGRVHMVTGRIASPLDRDPGRTAFVLSVESIDNMPSSGRLRVSVRDEQATAGYGDIITMNGRFLEPFGYRNPGGFDSPAFLARQGIFATLSVRSFHDVSVTRAGRGFVRSIQDMRERIRRHFLQAISGQGSAILQAMTLGEEGGLTDETRDRFMAAGVTHILSISGSHLGLVAFTCFGLLRWLFFLLPEPVYLRLTLHTDPRKIAAACTVFPVVFYALLAGGQTATIRSLIMILAVFFSVLLDRENKLLHSLATAGAVILIADPLALFEISFQLSFLSVLSIGYVVTSWNELVVPSEGFFPKCGRGILLLLLVSVTAGFASAPLVAYYFNQVSLVGIVSNVIVVPFAGFVVVPLGLTSGLLSLALDRLPVPVLNQAAADAFAGLVALFSRFPLAGLHLPSPGIPVLLASGVLLSSAAVLARTLLAARFRPFEHSHRVPRIAVFSLALSAAVLLLSVLPFGMSRQPRITFLDAGQGDCALVELPSGKTILVDGGGTRDNRFDLGRRVLAPYLWDRGISKIDLLVLSHPHPDHMNGLFSILRLFDVGEVWVHGLDTHLPGYDELVATMRERNIQQRTVSAGTPPTRIGEAELTVLHPRQGFTARSRKAFDAENNRSLVVRMGLGGMSFLFTGDIGEEAERAIIRTGGKLACDLLKVPHHGSRTSSSEAFLSRLRPGAAIISVGRGNTYRHPSEETVERLERSGARILRTDRDGAVIVTLRDGNMRVIPWAKLLLQQISFDDAAGWPAVERKNWMRVWERIRT